jgi:hypothetical protein
MTATGVAAGDRIAFSTYLACIVWGICHSVPVPWAGPGCLLCVSALPHAVWYVECSQIRTPCLLHDLCRCNDTNTLAPGMRASCCYTCCFCDIEGGAPLTGWPHRTRFSHPNCWGLLAVPLSNRAPATWPQLVPSHSGIDACVLQPCTRCLTWPPFKDALSADVMSTAIAVSLASMWCVYLSHMCSCEHH